MCFRNILKSKRGDVGYIQMAVTLLITVVIGAMLFGGAQAIVKNQLRPKLATEFGVTERDTAKFDTIIRDVEPDDEPDKNVLPEGAFYYKCTGKNADGTAFTYSDPLTAGQPIPDAGEGDYMLYGDYIYYYKASYNHTNRQVEPTFFPIATWNTVVADISKTQYGTILSQIADKPVTGLGSAFQGCTLLATAPTIPDGITDITGTFDGCTSLTSAPAIPNSVTSMWGTFAGCTSLTTAPVIPSSVTDMSSTFSGCSSLTAAPVIPNSVTSMWGTFQGCTSLATASAIPNGVTHMGETFKGCKSLTVAPTIPNSVTALVSTFENCSSLVAAPAIPNGVTVMTSTFKGCGALVNAPAIPNGVTNMDSTFYGCTSLTTAPEIPNSVVNVQSIFGQCTALSGKIQFNASPTDYMFAFLGTAKEIRLYGTGSNESLLEKIAKTSSTKNVTVIPAGTIDFRDMM